MEIFQDPHQFKVIVAGRRGGKSKLCAYTALVNALQKPNGVYFLLSPSYFQTKLIWEEIIRLAPREYVKKIMLGDLYIELVNGARIYAKSADNPHVLRGVGLDGCIFDETAQIQEVVWEEVIEPSLVDRNGWVVFSGTPRGKGWFYRLFLRGIGEGDQDFQSFHYTTYENPFIPKDWIDKKRKTVPELTFKQEYLAEFVDDGGIVFSGLENVLNSHPEEPKDGEFYVIGVDIGRHEDFTVIKAGKLSNYSEVYTERFNRTEWEYIKQRIREVYKRYNHGQILLDSTGYGDPIYEELAKEGIGITGVNLNTRSKPQLIENLQLMIENRQISLIDDPQLRAEFGSYTYKMMESGYVKYNAAIGMHDDIVISTALMAFGFNKGGGGAIGVIEPDKEKDEDEFDYSDMDDIIDWEEDEIDISS